MRTLAAPVVGLLLCSSPPSRRAPASFATACSAADTSTKLSALTRRPRTRRVCSLRGFGPARRCHDGARRPPSAAKAKGKPEVAHRAMNAEDGAAAEAEPAQPAETEVEIHQDTCPSQDVPSAPPEDGHRPSPEEKRALRELEAAAAKQQHLEEVRAALSSARASDEAQEPPRRAPRVLITVGLPGAGKSTFARRLCDAGNWSRVSQDELRSSAACERRMVALLCAKEAGDVIVDRCNADFGQRRRWIDLARMRGSHVGVLIFAIDAAECCARACARESHETLHDEVTIAHAIGQHRANFRAPTAEEGIDFVRVLRTEPDDIERLLRELICSSV